MSIACSGSLLAQAPTNTTQQPEDTYVQLLEAQRPGRKVEHQQGLYLIDAVIPNCPELHLMVQGPLEGRPITRRIKASGFGWTGPFYPAPAPADVGEHTVVSVGCELKHSVGHFRGPVARFQVRRGEVVDVGTLKLDFTRDGIFSSTGTTKRSIEPMVAGRRARLTSDFPRITPKIVNRPMTLIGPAEVKSQRGVMR